MAPIVVVFSVLVAQGLRDVPRIQVYDLEDHARALEVELPRVRVIPLDDFDPNRFL
jgi:uncharacterized protein